MASKPIFYYVIIIKHFFLCCKRKTKNFLNFFQKNPFYFSKKIFFLPFTTKIRIFFRKYTYFPFSFVNWILPRCKNAFSRGRRLGLRGLSLSSTDRLGSVGDCFLREDDILPYAPSFHSSLPSPARVILEWSRPTGFFATLKNDSVGRRSEGSRADWFRWAIVFVDSPFAKQIWTHGPYKGLM